jgi:hypothetical protein
MWSGSGDLRSGWGQRARLMRNVRGGQPRPPTTAPTHAQRTVEDAVLDADALLEVLALPELLPVLVLLPEAVLCGAGRERASGGRHAG